MADWPEPPFSAWAAARFSGGRWKVRVDRLDGTPVGWFQSVSLDAVVAKARDLLEDSEASVLPDVELPAEIEQNFGLAEQFADDARRELEQGIAKLRAAGVSIADVGYIIRTRHLRLSPEPITITTAEIARDGLPAGVVGVIWSDRGYGVTTTCRAVSKATVAGSTRLGSPGPSTRSKRSLLTRNTSLSAPGSPSNATSLPTTLRPPSGPAEIRITTFRSYAEQWRQIQPHRGATEQLVEQHLRRHVYPHIGDRPIGAIRQSEVQALVRRVEGSLAATTVQVVYGRVAAVFRAAVRDRVIAQSPCVDIKLPRPVAKVDNVMSTQQVLALADAFTPAHLRRQGLAGRYRALVLVGAGTGLRPGELFGLTVSAVDFLRRKLSVERQLVRVRGKGVELTTMLKTDKSRRSVPLAQVVVVDVLAKHLAQWPAHSELGPISTNERGGPIQQYPFSQAWATARTRVGLPAWVNGPHQLRHHFASVLIARGASVKVVQRRLGHASAKTTLDVYGHLFPGDEDATRAAIENELGVALAGDASATGPEST